MPGTPPETSTRARPADPILSPDSPSKKRVREDDEHGPEDDADRGGGHARDVEETPRGKALQHRPIVRASPKRQKRPPNKRPGSSVQAVDEWTLLEKPVRLARISQLPPEVEDLYEAITDDDLGAFIPFDVRDEFSALFKRQEKKKRVPERWFTPGQGTSIPVRRQKALEDMGALLDVLREAEECFRLRRHEPAWNSGVHHPLLKLAFDECPGMNQLHEATDGAPEPRELVRIRVENVTSATITGNCVPQIAAAEASQVATISVAAWSVSELTTSSISSDGLHDFNQDDPFVESQRVLKLDGTTHTRASSKKVDFALVLEPSAGASLSAAITSVRRRLKDTPFQSINPSGYFPIRDAPIAVLIETKTLGTATDPLIQLGMMAIAMHRRLHSLPVKAARGMGPPVTSTGVLMTLPLITVVDHQWHIYFARDNGGSIVCMTNKPSEAIFEADHSRIWWDLSSWGLQTHYLRATSFCFACGD